MKKISNLLVITAVAFFINGSIFGQTSEVLTLNKTDEICQAIKNEDLPQIKKLVSKNPKLVTQSYPPLLYLAASCQSLDIASFLIVQGADVNATCHYTEQTTTSLNDWTPLHEAMKHNVNIEMSKLLIRNGANVNASAWYETDSYDIVSFCPMSVADTEEKRELLRTHGGHWGDLFKAVEKNDLVALKNQTSADTPIHDEVKQPLLAFAAKVATDTAILEYLIDEKKLDVNQKANEDPPTPITPFHTAAAFNPDLNILKFLIEKGGDITVRTGEMTVFDYAVMNKNIDIAKYLINTYHFDVNHKNASGKTAVFWAAMKSDSKMIRFLVDQHQAKVNLFDMYESTPLHFAAMNGNSSTLKALVESGAEINLKRYQGNETPLFYWVSRAGLGPDYYDTVVWMVEHGADIRNDNKDILYHAVMAARPWGSTVPLQPDARWKTIKYFLEQGVNPNTTVGESAFGIYLSRIANGENKLDHISLWIKYGADVNLRDESGRTPAFYLSLRNPKGYEETMRILLDLGADINAVNNDGESILASLIRYNQSFEIYKFLIENGIDGNSVNKEGMNLLHRRMSFFTRDQLEYFIKEKKLDYNAKAKDGTMPIHVAASYYRNHELLKYLLELGVDPDARDGKGKTPLHHAIATNTSPAISTLLEHGAKWDTEDEQGIQPIHVAVIARNVDHLKILIQAGADIKAKSKDGKNLLHYAVMRSKSHINLKLLNMLVEEYGFDVNEKDAKGHTALHFLADYSGMIWSEPDKPVGTWEKAIDYLIRQGADINARTNIGATPLHKIAAYSPKAFRPMVTFGADIMAKDNQGALPLHRFAAHTIDDDLIGEILKFGYDINMQDNFGHTPLHYAIIQGGRDWIIRYLFENGADVHIVDKDGKTLLHFAANHKQSHYGLYALKYLIAEGLNVNAQDNEGNTPLHFAAAWDSRDYSAQAVNYLLQHGADPKIKNKLGQTPAECVQGSTKDDKLKLLNNDSSDEKK